MIRTSGVIGMERTIAVVLVMMEPLAAAANINAFVTVRREVVVVATGFGGADFRPDGVRRIPTFWTASRLGLIGVITTEGQD